MHEKNEAPLMLQRDWHNSLSSWKWPSFIAFHTGTAIRILSGFGIHWQANPGSVRIETQIANPGGKQDLDPG